MHTMSDRLGFESPEGAALAGWASTPDAHARVISVTVRGDRAEVVIDTDPTYPDCVYCVRRRADEHERDQEGHVGRLADPGPCRPAVAAR
jgi:hypothetical protein